MSINLKTKRRATITSIVVLILLLFVADVWSPPEWEGHVIRLHNFILLLATAVLAYATFVLAKHTKLMSDHDKEERRSQDIRKCIFLAESIISLPGKKEYRHWQSGFVSDESVRPFSELLSLGKYIHDSETKRHLEIVTMRLVSFLSPEETRTDITSDGRFSENLEKLRSRLPQEVIEWQRDLGSYSPS